MAGPAGQAVPLFVHLSWRLAVWLRPHLPGLGCRLGGGQGGPGSKDLSLDIRLTSLAWKCSWNLVVVSPESSTDSVWPLGSSVDRKSFGD